MNSLKCDAKTDVIDAKKLSKYGQERHEELSVYQKPSETQEKIRELSLYLEKIKVERAEHKNRLKRTKDSGKKQRYRRTKGGWQIICMIQRDSFNEMIFLLCRV